MIYSPKISGLFHSVRETHQIAEAQQEKNAKLREAFGISEYFVEGSSLDPQRKAKEAAAKAAAEDNTRAGAPERYELVRTPSPVAEKESRKRKRRDDSRYFLFTFGLFCFISILFRSILKEYLF